MCWELVDGLTGADLDVLGPGRRAHRRDLDVLVMVDELTGADLDVLALVDELTGATSMCWSWSTSSPASTNQARCPRFARLRGDRRETGAPGRAERPSKWRG